MNFRIKVSCIKIPFFVLLLIASTNGYAQNKPGLKLWYNKPSGKTWENALPIGNGRLGAMVFGNVEKETIQLNEHTIWSGGPNRNDNPLALDSLQTIRRLIFEGKQKDAERIANRVIITKKSHGQMFQPAGNVQLTFNEHENFTSFYRELDIERAVAKTSYKVGDVTYTREAFASFPDRVVVMRLTASKPGSISFTISFSTPMPKVQVKTTPAKALTFAGTTMDHEGVKGVVNYKGIVHVQPEGGTLTSNDTSVTVSNANTATIYISIATNFNNYNSVGDDEDERAAGYLNKVFRKPYPAILAAHVAAYQKYFNRVRLDLGTSESAGAPTDERLKNFNSVVDPQLVTLYYQYGRYLLICSSQPGGQPANLQGIWNDKVRPPWDSKYTININAQMNYWPAEKANLSELHMPFLEMVKDLSVTGQQTAKDMYGARGWAAHHNTDIWRATGAIDGATWGVWNGAGGWTSQHLWEHYLYTGDKAFLASIYPVLKGASTFYVDFLVEHPTKKWLVINPDMSPENAPAAHQNSSLDAGTTMTNQIVFDIFSSTIKAAELLKQDAAFVDTLIQMRRRLPPMQVGKHGQLQEWLDDIDDPKDNHRHISHLYGLFPSNQISPYRTPELYSAAKTTLTHRGDISTGWSMGWKVNWWARMLDGNHAYKLIQGQLSPVRSGRGEGGGSYNNLFDAHPPFQIDGNFGCTSGITEMLVQSANGEVHLLPALPDAWPEGSIGGIKAIGGFELLGMEWKDGRLVKAVVTSNLGGNLRLRLPNAVKLSTGSGLKVAKGTNTNPFYKIEETLAPVISSNANVTPPDLKKTLVYDLQTQRGKTYTLVAQ
ncbi:glycoside hydrolase family 95 protein [Segetibacter sp. 3557_3]|uniref:glycoside hydrolase family 95 protein n=1 Tax=Segetibacter sp. 3557_3 TaxID=2547429 RepID=UPI0010589A11|nr:glycoside hydrolase family 95 protein [Segetibacter sp. 3557_3]TDH23480.1 glycoside hydrolase family 95 protein [Segetibacter sp. 3557_3]